MSLTRGKGRGMSAARRFWLCIDMNGPIHPVHGQCWTWTGSFGGGNYGQLDRGGKPIKAHRLSWELHNSDAKDKNVLHKCDNTRCVNPDHLFLGSHKENMEDRNRKGRAARVKGEQNGNSKLTDAQVLAIRKRFRAGSRINGSRALARLYNVSRQAIMYNVTKKL